VTALLIQGVITSVAIVILYSQQSLTTMFLCLQGTLTVLWLASGNFFLVPVIRRSGRKLSDDERLAHLATLDAAN
jgi:hypothetical protein